MESGPVFGVPLFGQTWSMNKSLRPLEYCLGSETFTSETWHINEDTVSNFTHLKCILLWKFNFQKMFTVSPPMKKVWISQWQRPIGSRDIIWTNQEALFVAKITIELLGKVVRCHILSSGGHFPSHSMTLWHVSHIEDTHFTLSSAPPHPLTFPRAKKYC